MMTQACPHSHAIIHPCSNNAKVEQSKHSSEQAWLLDFSKQLDECNCACVNAMRDWCTGCNHKLEASINCPSFTSSRWRLDRRDGLKTESESWRLWLETEIACFGIHKQRVNHDAMMVVLDRRWAWRRAQKKRRCDASQGECAVQRVEHP